MNNQAQAFFWLHVKKSGGQTVRSLLSPYYVQVGRKHGPRSFADANPDEYNDILNNYRVRLGKHQFRRTLFARDILYRDRWERIYSFAFSRRPDQRCLSAFFYLWHKPGWQSLFRNLSYAPRITRVRFGIDYSFDLFLDLIAMTIQSDDVDKPVSLHFATHTAPMWNDIVDGDGHILLTDIFRLDDLATAINRVFETCNIDKRVDENPARHNVNRTAAPFSPKPHHMRKIEAIYGSDYDIYERCARQL